MTAKEFGVLQFVRFCEDVLEHPAGEDIGRPFRLEDWQVDIFEEALALEERRSAALADGGGLRAQEERQDHDACRVRAVPAALGCRRAQDPDVRRVRPAGEQALRGRPHDGRAFPFLLERIGIQDYRGRLYRLDGQGEILRLSSKPETAHGFTPSLVICDELAQWTQPSLEAHVGGVDDGGAGRRRAQVFAI